MSHLSNATLLSGPPLQSHSWKASLPGCTANMDTTCRCSLMALSTAQGMKAAHFVSISVQISCLCCKFLTIITNLASSIASTHLYIYIKLENGNARNFFAKVNAVKNLTEQQQVSCCAVRAYGWRVEEKVRILSAHLSKLVQLGLLFLSLNRKHIMSQCLSNFGNLVCSALVQKRLDHRFWLDLQVTICTL